MQHKGYSVNEEALRIIDACEAWYKNEELNDFHVRKNLNNQEVHIARMNFAKRCCADDANLCEIISVSPEKKAKSQEFIDNLLTTNRFEVKYREQLEKTSATGTVGAYIYLKDAEYVQPKGAPVTVRGGDIRINYCDADCIIPLTVENGLITECAFCATNKVRGREQTTLVIFLIENKFYQAETVVFDHNGVIINDGPVVLQLGDVKPFAIMTNAEVNNLDNMEGYGLPKVYSAIPLFKALDLCYAILYGDLSKGEKLLFINELLAEINKKSDGSISLTPQQKDLFVLLGEKLPQQDTLIQEYNPQIRVGDITKAFELVLSLLSISFGYGSKKYTFENGKITTATEYIGTKQDSMQELNKQRKQATDYISDIIHAAMWFANAFQGASYDLTEALITEFDDSYVTDREAELERKRNDAISFDIPKLKVWYLMDAYNLSEEEALEMVSGAEEEKEKEDSNEEDEED